LIGNVVVPPELRSGSEGYVIARYGLEAPGEKPPSTLGPGIYVAGSRGAEVSRNWVAPSAQRPLDGYSAGVKVFASAGAKIVDNDLQCPDGDGIVVVRGGGAFVARNRVLARDAGIRVETDEAELAAGAHVISNLVEAGTVGIRLIRARDAVLIRNTVLGGYEEALRLDRVEAVRLLGNSLNATAYARTGHPHIGLFVFRSENVLVSGGRYREIVGWLHALSIEESAGVTLADSTLHALGGHTLKLKDSRVEGRSLALRGTDTGISSFGGGKARLKRADLADARFVAAIALADADLEADGLRWSAEASYLQLLDVEGGRADIRKGRAVSAEGETLAAFREILLDGEDAWIGQTNRTPLERYAIASPFLLPLRWRAQGRGRVVLDTDATPHPFAREGDVITMPPPYPDIGPEVAPVPAARELRSPHRRAGWLLRGS
jgi:hypothetical protein